MVTKSGLEHHIKLLYKSSMMAILCFFYFANPVSAYQNGYFDIDLTYFAYSTSITDSRSIKDGDLNSYATMPHNTEIYLKEYSSRDTWDIQSVYLKASDPKNLKIRFYNSSGTLIGETSVSNGLTRVNYKNVHEINLFNYSGASIKTYEFDAYTTYIPKDPKKLKQNAYNGSTFPITWNCDGPYTYFQVYKDGELYRSNITSKAYDISPMYVGSKFKVRAVNDFGYSDFSNEITLVETRNPEVPTGLEAKRIGNYVQLTWNKSSSATSYNVYDGSQLVGDTTSNSINLYDLSIGSHIFYVSSVNANGESQKASITFNIVPSKPVVAVEDIKAYSSRITWNNVAGATSYDVYINGSFLINTLVNFYELTNLNENTQYSVSVIAKSSSGNSEAGNINFKTLQIPNPPTGLQATNITSDSIDLSWNYVEGSISYILDRDGNVLASTGGNTYKVSGLTPNTAYTFKVAVETQAGQSVYSDPIEIRTLGVPPVTPSGLSYDDLTTSGFKVYWLRQSDADSYDIYLNNQLVQRVSQTIIFNPSYTFHDLDHNTGYNVSIVAVNAWGSSSASEPLTVMTLPEPPNNLIATNITSESLTLTWSSVKGAINYILDQNDMIIGTTTENKYEVSGLTPLTTYRYKVAVVTEAGQSKFSQVLKVTTLGVRPITPKGLSYLNVTDASFEVIWHKQSDADTYDIYLNGDLAGSVSQPLLFGPSYSFDNLKPNTVYNVSVVAKNAWGASDSSEIVNVTTLATPPTGLLRVKNIKANSLHLNWNAVDDAENYEIYQDNSMIAVVEDTNLVVTGLTPLTTYEYKMKVDGESEFSTPVSVTTLGVPPSVPSGLSYTDLGSKGFTIHWLADEQSTSHNLYLNGSHIANVTGESYRFDSLNSNTNYLITIESLNSWGSSPKSEALDVKTLPPPPSGFKAIRITSDSIILTWEPVDGAIRYYVQKDSDFVESVEENCTISDLSSSTKYTLRVSVETQAGQSDYTQPVVLETLGVPPQKPIGLSAGDIKKSSFTVYWPKQEDAESYNVYLNDVLIKKVNQPLFYNPSYSFTGLEENKTYKVKIVAVNKWGQSPASDTLSVMTSLHPELSVSVDGNKLVLKWQGTADVFLIMVNDQQVAAKNKNDYVYEGEFGQSYKVKVIGVIQGKQFDSNVVTISVSSVPIISGSEIREDVAHSVVSVAAPLGGLLALALALKGSPFLVGIAKTVMRWF